jgi:hypothetical protein
MAGLLCATALGASAQTEVQPKSQAQSLACLVKPADAPRYPARHKLDRDFGGMRVLLTFKKPDAAPEVEVLFNSAREDMQDEMHRYVRQYRLPCLSPQDGAVQAVQEFSFTNTDREATPLPAASRKDGPPFCLVMPRHDMEGWSGIGRQEVEHVVVAATFSGDGQQPPEVKIIHSTGSAHAESAVRARLAEYRMPCRTGREGPQSFQQQFSHIPAGHRRHVFKREAFGLLEFLGLTREPRKLKALYDLNTMACPFKVSYMVYGGAVPNEARVKGSRDANRQPFLSWLAGLQLAFSNDRQANDLFGSELQIDVPCGLLDLKGEAG